MRRFAADRGSVRARLSTSDTAAKLVLSSRRAEPKTRAIPRGGATLERTPRFQSCTEAAMPERRRTRRRVAGIFVGAVIVTATVFGFRLGFFGAGAMVREDSAPPPPSTRRARWPF